MTLASNYKISMSESVTLSHTDKPVSPPELENLELLFVFSLCCISRTPS